MVYSFFINARNWALTGVIHYFYFFCREAASFNKPVDKTNANKPSDNFQSFESREVSEALSGLEQMVGSREGVHGVINSAIGKLSVNDMEGAALSLADRSGLDPATSGEAVADIYSHYQTEAGKYVKSLGADPDAVGDFFDTLDSRGRADIMRQIFNGNGKPALSNLVKLYTKKSKR